jgi:ligand-binding SRPBCC domain-containing protein
VTASLVGTASGSSPGSREVSPPADERTVPRFASVVETKGGETQMATLERSFTVKAPLEKVFSYLDEPINLLEIWPSLVKITDVKALPTGGDRYHWVYKMAGTQFEGDSETVEFVQNKHFLQKNTGEIPSTFDWSFAAENGVTKVLMKTEYEIPKTLLGKLAEPFLVKLNEREADTLIGNLKDRMET